MSGRESARADEIAVPLDLLLTTSATGVARRMMPDTSWSRFALNLVRRPSTIGERVGSLGHDLASIARGTSDRAPAKADKRFSDPAWQGNPLMKRSVQAYLAANETVDKLFADADLDWRDAEQVRFVLDVVMEGLAPSNNPLISPLGWKAIIDTGGLSLLRGVRHFLNDMAAAPRVPSMVEPTAFTVGETVAASPGAVVYRSEVFELIQYTPQTEKVYTVPLLLVPPVINKYYIMDIAPGRSMIEYFVRQGHQVFAISWRNPTAEHRSWGCDTYGAAILDALGAVEKISGSDSVHVQASCSGGILTAMTAAHLSAIGEAERLASLTLMVTVLTSRRPVWPPPSTRKRPTSRSRCRGARATSTVERWPKCSPGCAPPIWCGATGSTTMCRAAPRRRSTCCSGTPTPPACPQRCTATWCRWECTTR